MNLIKHIALCACLGRSLWKKIVQFEAWRKLDSQYSTTLGDVIYLKLQPSQQKTPRGEPQPAADFETWWQVYPRHIAKREAWRAWRKLDGQRPPVAELIAAVEQQRASDQWQRSFIPHHATWLHLRLWEEGEESHD